MATRMACTMDELRSRIAQLPRAELGYYPTPLVECPRLSEALGGPRILVKRDDLGGLALSGNKNRYIEFVFGDAVAKGADAVIILSANQSNYCRQVAAAAAKLGMKAVLVFVGRRPDQLQGNLILEQILGAEMHFLDLGERGGSFAFDGDDPRVDRALEELVSDLRGRGHDPYVINHAPPALSAVGYVNCALELSEQLRRLGITANYIVTTSTGGTQAGLVVGSRALGLATAVHGVCYHKTALVGRRERLAEQANATAELLQLPIHIEPEEIVNFGEYTWEFLFDGLTDRVPLMELIGRAEGILVDPSYVGRALYAIREKVKEREYTTDDTVVLIHTGGVPIIFDQVDELS